MYDELQVIKDELRKWASDRRSSGLFIRPDWSTQEAFGRVSDYVVGTYAPNRAREFLDKADPLLIAHAIANGGKVVTMEVRVPANSSKVKIPNVCDAFGVDSLNTYDMLRELGVVIG